MNRIEKVREYVDTVLLNVPDADTKRCGYLHLYGVSQVCFMIFTLIPPWTPKIMPIKALL